MEDKSKKTEKCEKNVTKILFSDFSPSFLRFNGHNVMYSAAAHCIHHGQTPYNHDNLTKSLRVTAKASRGRGPRAARTALLPPGTRGTRTPQWSGQCHWAPRALAAVAASSPDSGGSIAMSSHATTCPRVIPVLRRFFAVSTAYM